MSVNSARLKAAIPTSERPQTQALDRQAIGIGLGDTVNVCNIVSGNRSEEIVGKQI
jgi:hypothetical protein